MTTATANPAGAPAAAASLIELTRIEISPTNPRRRVDPKHLSDLAESIRKVGVLQPIMVRPHPQGPDHGYELVVGECRYRAATEAGLTAIPASVRDLSDDEVIEIQVIENLVRADVHPLDEAAAFRQLLATERYSVARVAERIGRSVAYVYDRVRLLDLIPTAQGFFLEDKIQAGHAIILARLKPADQERALDPDNVAVFQPENLLWRPDGDPQDPDDPGELGHLKTRTAKELQAWVDKHVRFDPTASDIPDLFPDTASKLALAKEEADKVIPITYDYHILPEAKDGTRVFGPLSWKRADGFDAKHCDHSVMGVIVIGPGRGEAFKVCTAKKKCPTHWGKEMRQAAKVEKTGAAGGVEAKVKARQEAEKKLRQEQEARQEAFEKARPEILKTLAARVSVAAATSRGPLASILNITGKGNKEAAMVPAGQTPESLVRHLAWLDLLHAANWWGSDRLSKHGKALGVDVASLIKKHLLAPEKPAKEKAKAATKKGSGKPANPSAKKEAKKDAPKRGVCQKCGCTKDKACQTPEGPCSWANTRKTLCSACK